MKRLKGIYNREFYELIETGSIRSAREVIPEVLRLTTPRSVVDVGCGVGSWLAAVREAGISDTVGIDGDYVPREQLRIPTECFYPCDLCLSLQLNRRFDLAICLEVAEHLEESRADSLIYDLTRLADAVLFSAAIPGQFGTGHINEQWPDYWAQKFLTHGYFALDVLRERFWDNGDVDTHYKQNSVLYLKRQTYAHLQLDEAAVEDGNVRRLVHPTLYITYMKLSHPFSALVFESRRLISGWLPPRLKRAVRSLMQ